MKTQLFIVLGLVLASTTSQAQTVQSLGAEMQRCRGVPDIAARAACYDAIALPGLVPGNAGPAAASPAVAGAKATGPLPAATAAPAVAAHSAAATPPSSFGLPAARTEAATDQLQSRIVGLVEAFPKGLEYQLENGQVWQVTDSLLGFYQLRNPKVTISRRFLGGFQMQIEGVSGAAKVRRVK